MRRLIDKLLFVLVVLSGCSSWRVEEVEPIPFVASARPAFVRLTLTDSSQVILRDPVGVGDSIEGLRVQNLHHTGPGEPVAIAATDIQQLAERHEDAGKEIALGLGVAAAAVAAFFGTILAIWAIECDSGCD
jgi:hypothetical protein